MDIQQIIAWLIVGIALFFAARHVWAEVRGLIHPSEAGGCPGCGECDAALAEKAAGKRASRGIRPAPEGKKTPLVPLQTRLPAHLEHLRTPVTPAGDPAEE